MKSFLWLFSTSADSRRAFVIYWCRYVHKYRLAAERTNLAKESVNRLTDQLSLTLTLLTGP